MHFLAGKETSSWEERVSNPPTNEHKKGTISGCELDLQVDSSQLVPPLQGLVHHMHTLPLCKTTLFVTQALLLFYFFLPQLGRCGRYSPKIESIPPLLSEQEGSRRAIYSGANKRELTRNSSAPS
ncbi:hypothetical protein D8B26_004271 [Coccidioides posadasii str. Silveira]|uniref:uncharacterized protein n=1 Tax=Coccidioides posadasii (strain RMSCC 757 / Silveira) TaxID=443226 RepID=UPI001BED4F5A|nr:hypothetical protein D8B26_004271 [Coccidioides posadasii str. Silveira]